MKTLRLSNNLFVHVHDAAFEPSKHPRGNAKNPGQFSKGSGGPRTSTRQTPYTRSQVKPAQTPPRAASPKPSRQQLQGRLGATLPKQPNKQNVKSLDDLYDKAKKDEPVFVETIKNVAKTVGGEAQFTPAQYAEPGTTLKSRESAERKMMGEYHGDPSQLRDILRATVVSQRVEDMRAAAYNFIESNKANIVTVKDRIVDPAPGGYRDILVNFRTPSGLISEVQFNTPPMIQAKLGDGHRIYEELRTLKTKQSPSNDQMIQFLEQKSTQLYNKAYQAGGNGNWA